MLHYADAGPLRVDAPDGGTPAGWHCAPAWRWNVKGGWQPYADAQADIRLTGEFSLIDESQVLDVQRGELRCCCIEYLCTTRDIDNAEAHSLENCQCIFAANSRRVAMSDGMSSAT